MHVVYVQWGFGGRELYVDFLIIDMPSFNVVFRMDWLGAFYATIDCHKRRVVFRIPDHLEFAFSSRSTSLGPVEFRAKPKDDKAMNLPKEADAMSLQAEVEMPKVVHDFKDVFPEEISGLPPGRCLEFSIDLIPGTQPISKALNRMAPAELAELRTQLDDLLEMGLIRPSTSPWGAPVLLVGKKDGTRRMCIDYRGAE